MEQNIVIKGTPQKNKPALITIIISAVLLLASFLVASYVFKTVKAMKILVLDMVGGTIGVSSMILLVNFSRQSFSISNVSMVI